MLLALVFLAIFSVSTTIILFFELYTTNETIEWLDERLQKLERDAVKITFTQPFTTNDEKVVIHPLVKKKINPKQFDGVKSEEPFVKTKKRKPKTVKEWEDEIDLGGTE
jgi:hypothetical protein